MISNCGTSTLGLYDFKKQLDNFGGVDYFRPNLAGGYLKNARVMLANGDIVKSTVDGNTNDPNVDMTGWGFDKDIKSVNDYTSLRLVTKPHDLIFVSKKYISGIFQLDKSDTSSTDNGGTIIVTTSGLRYKRIFDGAGDIAWFEADPTGGTDSSAAFTYALATDIQVWSNTKGEYNFGTIAGNTAKFTTTIPRMINWNYSKIVVAGEIGTYSSTTFLQAKDAELMMFNYDFDDTTYSPEADSRGVVPVSIFSTTANTSGYVFGNFNIIRGQSLLTVYSSNPLTARARDIKFVGKCRGGSVYYGVNLANNGDDFTGNYSVDTVYRILFAYGVNGVDAVAKVNTSLPSSGFINISSLNSAIQTRNIKAKVSVKSLGAPAIINTVYTATDAVFDNIDIDLSFEAATLPLGNPIVAMGCFLSSSAWDTSEKTVTMDKVRVSLNYPDSLKFSLPIKTYTPSINYGVIEVVRGFYKIDGITPKDASGVEKGFLIKSDGVYTKVISGTLTGNAKKLTMPLAPLISYYNNTWFAIEFEVRAFNSMNSNKEFSMLKYIATGYLSSAGAIAQYDIKLLNRVDASATVPNILVEPSADFKGFMFSITDGYTASTANLIVTARKSIGI